MDEFQCSGDANTCGGDLKGVCGTADRSAVYDTYLGDLSSCSISKKCSFKDASQNCVWLLSGNFAIKCSYRNSNF